MNWDRISNIIAIILVAICFVISIVQVLGYRAETLDPNVRTIRFAHWQLEGSVREAFDGIAREYERRHPGVRVEQVPIPERIYSSWLTAQLVGGTAPDIIQIGKGTSTDKLARFFVPLSRELDAPNPYNADYPDLRDLPWRDTFLDGNQSYWGFYTDLQEDYSVPCSMFTIRMFYNKSLFKQLTGHDQPPQTLAEFLAVCEQIADPSEQGGQGRVVPIAGSRYNAPFLLEDLFSSQTMTLAAELDREFRGALLPEDVGLAFLEGKWNLRSPAIRSGYALQRAVGKFMQPGFLSLQREDATFRFIQSRSVFFASGAWDFSSLKILAPFEIGVFHLPFPDRDDLQFGLFVRGPFSEAATGTGVNLGLTRFSAHPDLALDFLRFLTSREMNEFFVKKSNWLPAVVGVDPAPGMEVFMPRTEGFARGISFGPGNYPDTSGLITSLQFELFKPDGSVDSFLDLLERRNFSRFVLDDLQRSSRNRLNNARRFDAPIECLLLLSEEDPEGERRAQQAERLIFSQISQEHQRYWLEYRLRRISQKAKEN